MSTEADTTRFLGIVKSEGAAKETVKPRIDKYEVRMSNPDWAAKLLIILL